MRELNPADFIFGNIENHNKTITKEYDSTVMFCDEIKQKILQIADYNYKFHSFYHEVIRHANYYRELNILNNMDTSNSDELDNYYSNLKESDEDTETQEFESDYYYLKTIYLSDGIFSAHMQPLSFKFNCFLYHNLEETANELDKFKNFVLNSMKNMKKELGGSAFVDGIIRDSKGRDITLKALKTMEKALIVALGVMNGKPYADIVEEIVEGTRTPEQKMKARDDIPRHLQNATILAERAAEKGTFPFDENGEWKLN